MMNTIRLTGTPISSPITGPISGLISSPLSRTSSTRTSLINRFTQQLKDCFASLLRTPPKRAVLIFSLALTLPIAIAMFSASFKTAENNLLENRHITVFLNDKIENKDATLLATTLQNNQYILSAQLTPVAIPDNSVLAIDIQPAATLGKVQLENIVAELTSHTAIDFVAADSLWLQQNVDAINTMKQLSRAAVVITALITMLLVILITSSDLIRHRSELKVLKQMGASRSTLLKPLMLRSLILTVFALGSGILIAWGTIEVLPYLADMSTYSQIIPRSIPALPLFSLALLALFSSFLTVKLMGRRTIKSL